MNELDADEMLEMIRAKGYEKKIQELDDRATVIVSELVAERDVLQQALDATHLKIQAIKLAKEKWNPKGGPWFVDAQLRVCNDATWFDEPVAIRAGVYRDSREQATRAAKELRIFQRLLAYRDEFDPEYEWRRGYANCAIEWEDELCKWCRTIDRVYCRIGTVYMSNVVADALVDKLNAGMVEL